MLGASKVTYIRGHLVYFEPYLGKQGCRDLGLRPQEGRQKEGLKVKEMKIAESDTPSWKVPFILPVPWPISQAPTLPLVHISPTLLHNSTELSSLVGHPAHCRVGPAPSPCKHGASSSVQVSRCREDQAITGTTRESSVATAGPT